MLKHILAIDDDSVFLKSIKELLEYQKFSVETCENPLQALTLFQKNHYQAVLLDVKMPGMDGIELLEKFQQIKNQIPIIMVSGQSTISIAVESLKKGAFDFIEKPVDADRLLLNIQHALDKYSLYAERQDLIAQLRSNYQMVGGSKALQNIFTQIRQVGPTDAKVLITGETGTGKDLVAHAIHLSGDRASAPFVKINCAAIPVELMESELFGHKKGAFTGAGKENPGKFQTANGGTLFLDEIGDMDLMLQVKLLHVLQDKSFMMLGSSESVHVDVRIIAATNQDLSKLMKAKKFRPDLFHRLNVFPIHIPPLRKRTEDIPLLVHHFLNKFSEEYNRNLQGIDSAALQILLKHPWPGNIRELRHIIEKIAILGKNKTITENDVRMALELIDNQNPGPQTYASLKEEMTANEKNIILRALNKYDWKIRETAEQLSIDRSALFKKMRKLGIKKSV